MQSGSVPLAVDLRRIRSGIAELSSSTRWAQGRQQFGIHQFRKMSQVRALIFAGDCVGNARGRRPSQHVGRASRPTVSNVGANGPGYGDDSVRRATEEPAVVAGTRTEPPVSVWQSHRPKATPRPAAR